MALEDIGKAILQQKEIWIRLIGAVVTAAGNIRTESVATPNHDNRIKWADRVGRDPQGMSKDIFYRLLQNANVQSAAAGGAVTDVQIQNAVDGVVDDFATGS